MARKTGRNAEDEAGAHIGYRQISTTLIEEIYAGVWPVGAQLPTESELVERFAVSRNTVREALRELQDFGYLSKRRGTRSVVLRAVAENSFVNSVRSVDELLEYANAAHNILLSSETIVMMEDQAQALDCSPRSQWLRLQLLRNREAGGLPFCYSEIFVDPRYGEAARRLRPGRTVYSTIEEFCGITVSRVTQTIEAASANDNIALRLQVPPGSPILLARNFFYCEKGDLVEIGLAHFASGRYRLRVALDRKRAGGDAIQGD